MTSPAKLLLWLFVASSLYHLTSTASTTNDTEDILGENVNEMSYSDIKDVLENNKSDTDTDQSRHFEVLSESKIDEELNSSTPEESKNFGSWKNNYLFSLLESKFCLNWFHP